MPHYLISKINQDRSLTMSVTEKQSSISSTFCCWNTWCIWVNVDSDRVQRV